MAEDLEKILLGGFIKHPETVDDGVRETDFSSPKLQALFKSILSLIEKKSPIDPFLLSQEIKTFGWEISPSEILNIESEYFFEGMDLDHYKGLLRIDSRKRTLQTFLTNSLKSIEDPSCDYPEIEGKLFQSIMGILADGKGHERKTSQDIIKEVVQGYFDRKTERQQGRQMFGVPTGYKALDDTLGGFQLKDYGILAGRPHHGKSTKAMDFFLKAMQEAIPSLYVSLEQPSTQVLLHLIQKETGIEPLKVKTGNLSEAEERLLTGEVYKRFKEYPIHFEDHARTLNEISMGIRRMVFSHGVRFVVVDYLQLVENWIKGEPRHVVVAGISRGLKRLAMDLNISILALSQLNKNPEERESKRINLSDMRESEAISQDADFVIFIHRPKLMGKDDRDHLELAKNRHGKTIQRINVDYDERKNTYREKLHP